MALAGTWANNLEKLPIPDRFPFLYVLFSRIPQNIYEALMAYREEIF